MSRKFSTAGIIALIAVAFGVFLYGCALQPVFIPIPTPAESNCSEEGERFSPVYKDEYPEHCCEGLTEWHSGMDTRISIEDRCYETMRESGYPVGICLNCGNGVCEDIEDICNCPLDCTDGENSDYKTVEDFCSSSYEAYCSRLPDEIRPDFCDLC